MTIAPPTLFGAGGAEPWSALLRGGAAHLAIVREDGSGPRALDAGRWFEAADAVDQTVLDGVPGPLLDVGCGPGRMVRAAIDRGLEAWGLDVEPAAVVRCRAAGLPVIKQDLFARLPREGGWGSVLLLDGNVGIGGDVRAVLDRCGALLRPGGVVVAEAHADPERDAVDLVRVRDADGRESGVFRWAEVGTRALLRAAGAFAVEEVREAGGRTFLRLRRRP